MIALPTKQCPECRQPIEKAVETLPKNYVATHLLELITQSSGSHFERYKKEILCGNCDTNLATHWCQNCQVDYCSSCCSTAHGLKALQNHIRVPIQEKKSSLGENRFICQEHNDVCKAFCVDCQSLVCTGCLLDHHQKHNATSLHKRTNFLKSKLTNQVEEFYKKTIGIETKEQQSTQLIHSTQQKIHYLQFQIKHLQDTLTQEKRNFNELNEQKQIIGSSCSFLKVSIEKMTTNDLLDDQTFSLFSKELNDTIHQLTKQTVALGGWEDNGENDEESNDEVDHGERPGRGRGGRGARARGGRARGQ